MNLFIVDVFAHGGVTVGGNALPVFASRLL
jgi:hypothetical protein